MKTIKLLTDILKASDKRDQGGKKSPFRYGERDGSIGVCVDGHYIAFVRKDRFYLDLEKCFPKQTPLNLKKIIFEDPDDALDAYDTGTTRRIPAADRTVRIFETDRATIWIDEDSLKYFDLDDRTVFKGTEKNKPFYIYEDTNLGLILVGFILPVNHS